MVLGSVIFYSSLLGRRGGPPLPRGYGAEIELDRTVLLLGLRFDRLVVPERGPGLLILRRGEPRRREPVLPRRHADREPTRAHALDPPEERGVGRLDRIDTKTRGGIRRHDLPAQDRRRLRVDRDDVTTIGLRSLRRQADRSGIADDQVGLRIDRPVRVEII